MSDTFKGIIAIIATCVVWGLSPIYYKALSHVPPLEVLSHRALWSFLFFAVILLMQGRRRQMSDLIATQTGRMLLALPGMGDPRFERSVIALCLHDEAGAMGVDIGRLHDAISFSDVLDQLADDDLLVTDEEQAALAVPEPELLMGGPVEPQRGFVIHSLEYSGSDTISVAGRFALSTTPGIVVDMGLGKGPRQAALALGYAGWGPGQLDEEMTRNGWIALDVDPLPLIDLPADERWHAALREAGIDPAMLSGQFGSA